MAWVLPVPNSPQAFSRPGSSGPATTAPLLGLPQTLQHLGLYQIPVQLLVSLASNPRAELTHEQQREGSPFVSEQCICTILTHPHLSQTWGLDSLPSLVPFLQRKHISMCGSLNSQASHFHPPTSTFSRTSCLSLAKYQERAAFSFHDRVDPAGVPVLTGLEIYQSDCKEVSFFGLPLLKRHYFSDNQPEPLKASPRTKCKCSSVNHQQLQGTFRGRTLTTNTQLPQQLHKQGCFPQIPLSYIYGHLLLRLSEVSALWYFTPLLWRGREGLANSYGVEIHRGFLKPNIFIYLGTSVRVRRLEKNSASKL